MKRFTPEGFERQMIEHLIQKYEEAERNHCLATGKGINEGCETRDNIVIDTPYRTFQIQIITRGFELGTLPPNIVLEDSVEEHRTGEDGKEEVVPVLDLSGMPLPLTQKEKEERRKMELARGKKGLFHIFPMGEALERVGDFEFKEED